MEEEISILRAAFEQLAEKQETTIHTLTQQIKRNEKEFENELKLQRQQVDDLKNQLIQQADLQLIVAEQANLNERINRLSNDQSFLWDSISRISGSRTNPRYKDQKDDVVVSQLYFVDEPTLHAESDRLMDLWHTEMSNMAEVFHTNFDDMKEMVLERQVQSQQAVEIEVKKLKTQLHKRIERLVTQLNGNLREVEEIKEDQEISNMALVDSLVSMKTKFDSVMEDVQTTSDSSVDSPTLKEVIQKSGGKDPANILQVIERKNGQWNAQIRSVRTELRTLKREVNDQRQDSADLKKVMEQSIDVLGLQAETTANLCERQLQRVSDLVRNDFVTGQEFRKLQIDYMETVAIWKDRFNELLHELKYNRYSRNGGVHSPRETGPAFGASNTSVDQSEYTAIIAMEKERPEFTAASSKVHAKAQGPDEDIIDLTAISDERDDIDISGTE